MTGTQELEIMTYGRLAWSQSETWVKREASGHSRSLLAALPSRAQSEGTFLSEGTVEGTC